MKKKYEKKRSKFITFIAIVALIAFLWLSLAPYIATIANAATKQEVQQKIIDSQNKKSSAQSTINKKTAEKTVIEAEKEKLDNDIAALEDKIYGINLKIIENESQINILTDEITEAEEKIVEYGEQFQSRATYMYKYGTTSYINILFGSASFSDLIYNMQIVKRLTAYDDQVLEEMADAKQVIVENKAAIELTKAANIEHKGNLSSEKSNLDVKLRERQTKIAALNSDIEEARRIADQEDAAMKQLKNQLESMTAKGQISKGSGTVSGGGTLLWPSTCTTITSPYGTRFHPIQQRYTMHTGIDIGASYGSNVFAVADGTVKLSGWNGGYGKCIVIDHGNGLSTLYGHNSVLSVSTGANVTKGQVIALVGSTGNSTGPHIHFEVLVNGQHTNPLSYLN